MFVRGAFAGFFLPIAVVTAPWALRRELGRDRVALDRVPIDRRGGYARH